MCGDGWGMNGGRAAPASSLAPIAPTLLSPPQPGKCLYTSMRELVENSLDATEAVRALPDIEITIEEISQERLNAIRGVANVARRDAELYHDFETDDQKKAREGATGGWVER
jgi:hypothetical protein